MASVRDCNKIQTLLSEYVDGILPETDSWAVKMHLSSCSVCGKIVSDFTKTSELLSTLPTRELSENFEARLARRLADQVLAPRPKTLADRFAVWWSRPVVRPAMASGLALAVLLPVAMIFRPGAPVGLGAAARTDSARLDTLAREHLSEESSEAFGDPSSLLLVSSAQSSIRSSDRSPDGFPR